MNADARAREIRVMFIAVGLAVLLFIAMIAVFTQGSTIPTFAIIFIPYLPGLIIGTALSAKLFWRRILKSGETRKRGTVYGGLCGLCALIFAAPIFGMFVGIFYAVTSDSGLMGKILMGFWQAAIMSVIIIPLSFIFGGFLAPIIRAVAGYFITKNPDDWPA